MRFTLDMNCIIDVEDDRANAPFVRELVSLHGKNEINVAISSIGASERQIEGGYANSFTSFQEKLSAIGFEALELLPPLSYYDISFYDHCVWADENETLEARIHNILFQEIKILWEDQKKLYRGETGPQYKYWRNAKCDVLAVWCHIKHGGGVFVTSDSNFYKETKIEALRALGVGIIAYPKDALTLAKAG